MTALVADTKVWIAAWRTDRRGESASAARSDYWHSRTGRTLPQRIPGAKGGEAFGMVREQSNPKIPTVVDYIPSIQLLEGDLHDPSSLLRLLEKARPDEIYNPDAISFVSLSFKQPELTGDITGIGVLRILKAVRIHTQGSMNGVRFSAGIRPSTSSS